jgi:outer membrane protein assembly factor BamB
MRRLALPENEPAGAPPGAPGSAKLQLCTRTGAAAGLRRPMSMPLRSPIAAQRMGRSPRTPPRGRLARVGVAILVIVLAGGGLLAGRSYLARWSLDWQIRQGLQLLEQADSPASVRRALDKWEAQTRTGWEGRIDELVTRLYTQYPLTDLRVRRLLERVAGTDYGARREDWQRWTRARQRLRAGQQPEVGPREAVRLEEVWTATVGFSAWFTTIIPLDGQIYVASLGAHFDDPQDRADGVVRVDGQTGASTLIFTPPAEHRGPHDVIGIAACGDGLYAACYNGYVYRLDREGQVRWHKHVGGPVVSPPLVVDVNQDGEPDVIVVTRAGKVVALSGKRGAELWVTPVSQPAAGRDMLGATLALGRTGPWTRLGSDALRAAGLELVVTTPAGDVEVLALRNGKALWRHDLPAGTLSGGICHTAPEGSGPPAYVADRAAGVWALVNPGRGLEAAYIRGLALGGDETLIAALRTTVIELGKPPLIVACPTGSYDSRRGAVCLLGPDDVHWRLGLDGAIWGTPAVADLNGDRKPELVVAVIEPRDAGRGGTGVPPVSEGCVGVLSIVSLAGHCLHRVVVDAPVECSPVVADVDGDQRLELLIADQSGVLHCYKTAGYGPVEWGLYGGDSHNTRNYTNAYAYGQTLFGRQWDWRPE